MTYSSKSQPLPEKTTGIENLGKANVVKDIDPNILKVKVLHDFMRKKNSIIFSRFENGQMERNRIFDHYYLLYQLFFGVNANGNEYKCMKLLHLIK